MKSDSDEQKKVVSFYDRGDTAELVTKKVARFSGKNRGV